MTDAELLTYIGKQVRRTRNLDHMSKARYQDLCEEVLNNIWQVCEVQAINKLNHEIRMQKMGFRKRK